MSNEVGIGEILKREAEENNVDVGYQRVDIFEVLNRNLKLVRVDIGEDKYGDYAVFYFDNGKAVKSWSGVLVKQGKTLQKFFENNKGKKVKVRITKPKGKQYYTLNDWE